MDLRDYQERAIGKLRASLRSGKRRPILVCPTGAGKSVIFGQVIVNCVRNLKKVLWIVHRRNLVIQMRDTLKQFFDINAGIIMSGIEPDVTAPVQLCTVQTYRRRLDLDELTQNRFYVNPDVVLIDECHRGISNQYKDLITLYGDKILIGCTATPMRGDGRGLGEVFDDLVVVTDVKELTDKGYLSPVRYFAPTTIDLSGVGVRMGDYVVGDLERKTNTKKLNGDIVENWLKSAQNRNTLVFCVNVKHSLAVRDAFERAGVGCDHLDARSPDDARGATFRRMETGAISVITNVAVYQEGLDVPSIAAVVMARPTKSLGLYRQCCGRGLRIFPGKKDTLIFDHGNVIEENGFLDDPVIWTLDGAKKAYATKTKPRESRPVKCRVCHLVFEGARVCPDCGSPVKTFGRKIEATDEALKEIKGKKNKPTPAEKRQWYSMFLHHARDKGWSDGWAYHKTVEKFGSFIQGSKSVEPIKPSDEVKRYIRYLNIKYAKSKQRAV